MFVTLGRKGKEWEKKKKEDRNAKKGGGCGGVLRSVEGRSKHLRQMTQGRFVNEKRGGGIPRPLWLERRGKGRKSVRRPTRGERGENQPYLPGNAKEKGKKETVKNRAGKNLEKKVNHSRGNRWSVCSLCDTSRGEQEKGQHIIGDKKKTKDKRARHPKIKAFKLKRQGQSHQIISSKEITVGTGEKIKGGRGCGY